MRLSRIIGVTLAVAALAPILGSASQAPSAEVGAAVYQTVANSVFLVEMTDADQNVVATGTAFVVDPQHPVTNAHVVRNGSPGLNVAGIRLECIVEKIDAVNDLAFLRVASGSGWVPLKIAAKTPAPGTALYAIGNPRGLERSISEGLFSGTRTLDGRQLMQTTTAISPGSSGSPVVLRDGSVVGVAVGSISDGQNLNFAIPANVLTAFLAESPSGRSTDFFLAQVTELNKQQAAVEFSVDDSSAWQRLEHEIQSLLTQGLDSAQDSPPALLQIGKLAMPHDDDLVIRAGRTADRLTKGGSAEAKMMTAQALSSKALFADNGDALYAEAEALALSGSIMAPTVANVMVLANIQSEMGAKLNEAYANYQRVQELNRKSPSDEAEEILYSLFRAASRLERPEEAKRWFGQFAATHTPSAFQWRTYARFLDSLNVTRDYLAAGRAWEQAAMGPYALYSDWCEAAESLRSSGFAEDAEDALRTARVCIEKGARVPNSEIRLGDANRIIGAVLNDRGVYGQAIVYTRQSISLNPNDAWAHYELARALNHSQRSGEAQAAANAAVALSDGRYGYMFFELGSAYFDQENWPGAWQAFQRSAELMPLDGVSAQNVAAAYYNAKFYSEALKWYQEALKRTPASPDRDKWLRLIEQLRVR